MCIKEWHDRYGVKRDERDERWIGNGDIKGGGVEKVGEERR